MTEEFAQVIKSYGLRRVKGDRYEAQWVVERSHRHGIRFEHSEHAKSDPYREFVAPVNGERVELLDLPVLRAQLLGLERSGSESPTDSGVPALPGARYLSA